MIRSVTLPLLAAALALASAAAAARDFKAGDIVVVHPWARATPPGASVGGGYVVIRNTGSAPDRLLGGTADFAEAMQIHQTSREGDMMMMREVTEGIAIPPGGEIALGPGGYHAMFVGLAHPLVKGRTEKGTLRFEKAGTVAIEWSVEAIGAMAPSAD